MSVAHIGHFELDYGSISGSVAVSGVSFSAACTILVSFTGAGTAASSIPTVFDVESTSGLVFTQQAGNGYTAGLSGHTSLWSAQTDGPISGETITLFIAHPAQLGVISIDGFTGLSRPLANAVAELGASNNGGTASTPTVTNVAITDTTSLEVGASIAGGNSSGPTFTAVGYTQYYAPPQNSTGQNTAGFKINAAAVSAPNYKSGPTFPDWAIYHTAFKTGPDPAVSTPNPVIAWML